MIHGSSSEYDDSDGDGRGQENIGGANLKLGSVPNPALSSRSPVSAPLIGSLESTRQPIAGSSTSPETPSAKGSPRKLMGGVYAGEKRVGGASGMTS